MKTIALAYLNDKEEIVAWSADTFGSPRGYPKTYGDKEETRRMLLGKFKTREAFGAGVATLISNFNPEGGNIIGTSLEADKDIFAEKGIITSKIISLNLLTNYERNNYSPTWEQIKNCVDTKDYTKLE